MLRRALQPNRGMWAFPGGLVEIGESLQDAILREVKEEVGIDVKLEGLLDAVSDVHLDDEGKVRYHYVIVDYVASPLSTKLVLNGESSSCGWFSPSSVLRMNVSENTKNCVRKFQRMTREPRVRG